MQKANRPTSVNKWKTDSQSTDSQSFLVALCKIIVGRRQMAGMKEPVPFFFPYCHLVLQPLPGRMPAEQKKDVLTHYCGP